MSDTKKNIVFVDDEPDVLQGMKRMLRPLRTEWNMTFFDRGEDALVHMDANPCDVIVSDMRMPGMDGMQLLTRVNESHSHVIRIVLSGQADRETVMRAVEPTHQYLAKPCQADLLKATVSRACALKDLLHNDALQGLITKAKNIPSLPSVYNEVSKALGDVNIAVEQVGEIISKDVAMTAKLLKLVNSAYFGIPRQVDGAAQAATILGLEMVKSLVLSVGVFSHFEHLNYPGFSIHEFEKHSQRVGLLAKAIAAKESDDPQVAANAYLGGFMHDIGKLVLIQNMADEYAEVLKSAATNNTPLHLTEQEHLGASHAAVGAYVLGIWGLPGEIVESIAFHHLPSALPEPTFRALTAVHAANAIDHEITSGDEDETQWLDLSYLDSLALIDHCDSWRQLASSIADKDQS